MKNNFYDFLDSRNFIHQSTDEKQIKKLFKNESCIGYIGFDCTSDSLHVGSLLPLMILRHFQNFGHKPLILLGGGTTLIGDPSGKDSTRKILSIDEISQNKKKLKLIFERFVSFDPNLKNSALLVDNFNWLSNLNLIDFLREIGSKFSVNKMISLESSKLRLQREQNLSFLEFNYSILQAYDFLELHNKYNCSIQFGGSDQWGNIISGIELIKKVKDNQSYGLTTPLITTSTGNKMGKTADGAIWLSKDKLNVKDFWQYWRNTSDEDTIKFLLYFTDIKKEEILEYQNSENDINKLKILLANEVTKLCHGEAESKRAENEAKIILSRGFIDSSVIDNCQQKITIKKEKLNEGLTIKQTLIDLKLTSSNGESKRLITQGGVKINDNIINNKDQKLDIEMFKEIPDLNSSLYVIIYLGKKKYGIVELIS